MTTGPQDGTDSFEDDPTSFEDDPTGMRALLSSLPDPGPMPSDLVTRIRASLAAEATARADQGGPTPAKVLPMPPRPERRLGVPIPRRRLAGPPKWLLPVAAAAVVVAGGGAVVSGMLKSGSLSAGAGDMSRETSAAAEETPAPMESAGRSASEQRGPAQGGTAAPSAAAGSSRLSYLSSGRAFDADSLSADVTRLVQTLPGTGDLAPAPAAVDFGTGGALACVAGLGAPASAPVVIETGTLDGTPATLIAYAATPGTWTASLVGPACGTDSVDRLAGPVTVSPER